MNLISVVELDKLRVKNYGVRWFLIKKLNVKQPVEERNKVLIIIILNVWNKMTLYMYIYNIENRKNCRDALKNLLEANNNTRKLVLKKQL
jgi:hypothetical protein